VPKQVFGALSGAKKTTQDRMVFVLIHGTGRNNFSTEAGLGSPAPGGVFVAVPIGLCI